MTWHLSSLADLARHPFDDIIDVRAPAEFAEDRLPGALSLPVLDDAERARVGTIYTREDKFLARKIGAALVARNAAGHLEGALANRPGNWQPLVYCWRGGQRSGSFASILSQIGWRVRVLDGGYRSYRRAVVAAMRDTALPHRLILLDGNTGTAKTELLAGLAARGHQVVDLEGLAGHRGSVFGATAAGQPPQKLFEGRLAMAFAALDPARPVLVEAESNKIGDLHIPPAVWHAMRAAPRLTLTAPVAARVAYLMRAYADLVADTARLSAQIASLVPLQGRERVERWLAMAASGALADLAADLLQHHYDPRYARARKAGAAPGETIGLRDLAQAEMPANLDAIERALAPERQGLRAGKGLETA